MFILPPARWLPFLFTATLFTRAATLPPGFAETKIASGLNPTTMTFSPDGRLFLCEKQGILRLVKGETMENKPVLDISAKVESWNERGLLSVCFDPDFTRNGWIYLYYTHNRNPADGSHNSSNNRVSRFTVKDSVADPASEKVILEIDNLSKTGWHNGGGLAFGKDGKLYVSTGENANGSNAQDGGNLLGKLLRIDKDGGIPADNPYYHKFTGKNRAIAALGLRNPFALAVRPGDGLLYLNMVGANYEQIERYETGRKPAPVNYGWPQVDGPPRGKNLPDYYRAPEYAYDHGKGRAVALCSGDFYSPAKPGPDAFPASYNGNYIFCDYGGWISVIDPAKPGERRDFASKIDRPIDVDIAPDGALWYIERAGIPGGSDEANSASKNGTLWRVRWTGGGNPDIATPSATAAESPPATLSATGLFADRDLKPRAGVVSYGINSSIWADGATVRRWVALPPAGKIGFAATGGFKWPDGTKFVQQFDIVTDEFTGAKRKLETRLLALDASGGFGYGATYRWREDGTDADLVPDEGREEIVKIKDKSGDTRDLAWTYPSRGLCYLCHTPAAGYVLGANVHQLNGGFGDAGNQLAAWSRLHMFGKPLDKDAIAKVPSTTKLGDRDASPELRVRSYLDANCACCHRPGGTGAGWDARFETPLAEQGIVNGEARDTLGIDGAKLMVPGDIGKSIIYQRMNSIDPARRMPPVTRGTVDEAALRVVKEWIESAGK